MPNHVTTICTVTGSPPAVAAFVERHILPVQCDKHEDCKATPALGYACLNLRFFDFASVIPRPPVLDDTISPDRDHPQNRLAEKETGYSNWYDWAIANWGTKWGAYSYEERERDEGRFVFKFETAWAFPLPVFNKLAELHPGVVLEIASFDEGWNFGCEGQFNGGNDYREDRDLATDEHYERVYGHAPEHDEDEAPLPIGTPKP
jgi:hypothetical protein